MAFIIPALNEESGISETLEAIHAAVGRSQQYEIVVVDNGSTDATAAIALEKGARVIHKAEGTIGSLRNEGVRHTSGDCLVFLDADVVLTSRWGSQISATLQQLQEHPRTLTGTMTMVRADGGWIERIWFATRTEESYSLIGSAHLIVPRSFFEEIGGFDEALETGEDHDLSQRALGLGGRIAPEEKLVAEHRRYPRSLGDFILREAWHGSSDMSSLRSLFGSRVALAALLFGGAHFFVAGALILGRFHAVMAGLAFIVALCLGSSLLKYRVQRWSIVLATAGMFYFYYLGRLLSAWGRFSAKGKGWGRR